MKNTTLKKQKWFSIWVTCVSLILLLSASLQVNAQVPYGRTATSGGTYSQLNGAGITIINTDAQMLLGFADKHQDDGGVIVTLPFTFTYMGANYTDISFCTNGWISAGTSSSVITGSQSRAPASLFNSNLPNFTIAAWFRDGGANFPSTGGTPTLANAPGSMRHGLTGTDEYTFQWDQAVGSSFAQTLTNLISYQITLYGPASSSPGRIAMLYGPTLGTLSTGASLGIEDGVSGTNHYINALNGLQNSTATSTAWPGNGNGYIFFPLVPCVSPIDQPTGLTLSAVSTSQINGTFAAAVTPPSGYMVVRYPTLATVTNPVDGTAYSVEQSLGAGKVIASGASTSFSDNGLLGSTTYDYYVYSYNTDCIGAPLYNVVVTSGQNSGTQTTAACGSITSPLVVGPTGTYATLSGPTGALAAIASSGISAPLVIELQSIYTAAGETYPITINYNGCVSASNPITIRPELGSGPLTITSANTTATFDLSGANYVTLDGRPGGIGASKNFIIENTSTTSASSGNAILLRNEASNNVLTYLDVKAANGNASSSAVLTAVGAVPGAIAIGTTTGVAGNDNNTISFCDVHSTGANMNVGIYAGNGTTAGSAANNDNNSITDNNIFDYFNAATASAGLDIVAGNNNYTITNNRFYQTATRTYTASQIHRVMWVTPNTGTLTSASGYTINNNTIGYNSSAGTGTYTTAGAATHTFIAMDLSLGMGTASSVQGNTLTNMAMTTTSTSTTALVGIQVANGNVNVGTITGNLIGSNTVNGAINFTTSGALGAVMGIRATGGTANTINIANNQVSGINVNGSTATVAAGFIGLNVAGGTNVNLTNNIVGSATLANSINAVTVYTGSAAQVLRGIAVTSGTLTTISGNLIANLNSNSNGTGTTSTMTGIQVSSSSSTITNNTIRNLSSSANTTGGGATSAIVGIAFTSTSTTAASTITGNTIHTLRLTHPTTLLVTQCEGIFYSGPTSLAGCKINKNFIHSLSIASPANTAGFLTAMDISAGLINIENNMIRLGVDHNGASVFSGCSIRGISENSATSNIHHNSIYIGGTGVLTSSVNSFAYHRSATTNADNVRNNIFVNNRSNATTGGKHYSVFLTTSNANLTLDFNNYLGSGTGYVFGNTGAADVATYASGWLAGDINSIVGNPQFLDANGTSASVNLHINAAIPTSVEQTGASIATVTDDFDNQTRASLSPNDLGADAGIFIPLNACVGVPAIGTATITTSTPVCGSGSKIINLPGYAHFPGLTYQWQESTTGLLGSFVDVTTGSGGTTNTYSTPVLTSDMYYQCKVKCFYSGDSSTSTSVGVIVYTVPVVSSSASTSTICNPGGVAVSITASGASTYTWNPTTGLTPTTGSPVSSLVTSNTIYTVTGTDANGCTATSTTEITTIPGIVMNSVTASPNTFCHVGASTLTANAGPVVSAYCTAGATTVGCTGTDEAITNVTFASINNTSTCAVSGQYQDFTSVSTPVVAGSNYPISITNIHSFSGDSIVVWIDYNQNGILNDPGEATSVPYVHIASGVNTSNGSITIPSSALNGPTRMRIRIDFNQVTHNPCGILTFGEVEDYTVIVSGGMNPSSSSYAWSQSGTSTLGGSITNIETASNITANTTYSVVATALNGCMASGSVSVVDATSYATVTVNAPSSCYTWPINGISYDVNGSYTATMVNANALGCDSIVTLNLTLTPGVTLAAKALLSGSYDTGTGMMHDSLRTLGLVPTAEPYTAGPYNKPVIGESAGEATTSTELGVTGNNAIVDWIFVEVRSASNSSVILATKRALIQRDGDIVGTDGVSPVFFSSLSAGSYFISVKHRNHLGVMTAMPVSLASCPLSTIDFTNSPLWVKIGEANPPAKMYGSVATLWAADANYNKNTKYNGLANDKASVLTAVGAPNNVLGPVYRAEDANMDGKVKYNNTDNDRNVIAAMVGVSTPNNIVNQHTPN